MTLKEKLATEQYTESFNKEEILPGYRPTKLMAYCQYIAGFEKARKMAAELLSKNLTDNKTYADMMLTLGEQEEE